ncbi:hypothetical protein [Methylorubrum extorquens]|uniref:Uncharacterized protein n=1 Tax=Methylorubrum extorquens TaxID=408 RepID=A0AAX3WG23_METEX|nr:hypothetical protein [Methylorubrum extorquens]WHQ70483.1 hypothetical protein KEC54_02215 [Methylorubrum extorquens]
MNAFVEQFEEAFVHRNEGSDTEVATDALLRSMVESERVGLTFSAVRDGGVLTTWQVPGRAQLGPDLGRVGADLTGDSYWRELLRLGERIYAVGGLDALDEANMYIVHMDPQHSDWRAMVLESVWFNIGRE